MPPPLVPDLDGEGDLVSFNYNGQVDVDDEPFKVVSDVLSLVDSRNLVSLEVEVEVEAEQELDEQLNSGAAEQQQHIITPDEQLAPEAPEGPSSPSAPIADMDIPEGDLADDELPAPEELPAAAASAKKRGRPAATPGKTSAKAKTPRTAAKSAGAASAATSGRKRKAADVEDDEPAEEVTPAKRPRGRPPRDAAATASARLAARDSKKRGPGRPKGSGTTTKATTDPKRGGPKVASKKDSSTNDEAVPKGEYEVEEILESVIDADTFEHMYRVKWKGYGMDETTWEPKTNLAHAAALLRDFDARQAKQTRKPRGRLPATALAASTASKSKEVKKPGRPVGRPKKSAGRPAAKAAVAKPVAQKPAGRPAPSRRGGRPRRTAS